MQLLQRDRFFFYHYLWFSDVFSECCCYIKRTASLEEQFALWDKLNLVAKQTKSERLDKVVEKNTFSKFYEGGEQTQERAEAACQQVESVLLQSINTLNSADKVFVKCVFYSICFIGLATVLSLFNTKTNINNSFWRSRLKSLSRIIRADFKPILSRAVQENKRLSRLTNNLGKQLVLR